MVRKSSFSFLRWFSIGLIIMAVFLMTVQLVRYRQIRTNFPPGLQIAGIPVGELNYIQASERLLNVYSSPIEVFYDESIIQIKPANLNYDLKIDSMLAIADKQRTTESFWSGFWNYIWNRSPQTRNIPLQTQIDEEAIREYLINEISSRYDQPSIPPMPIPGETGFYPGTSGKELDIDRSMNQIIQALNSPSNRSVRLLYNKTSVTRPSLDLLEVMLRDIVKSSTFDGLIEVYIQDLKTNQTINFVENKINSETFQPEIAFSSWSTIKIPVMLSAFKLLNEPYAQETLNLVIEMIDQSDNESTDKLAQTIIDQNLAPLLVTEDLSTLGLINTFWSGYFYPGAPLLDRIVTEANTRLDVDTEPDIYSQTTPRDLGLLLQDIYYCSEFNGGSLVAAFGGSITQKECQLMVQYLGNNKIGVLLQAGVPSGTIVAHKHGWAYEVDDGYIHTIGDAGIVYSPGGNFVIVIFAHHPVQAIFDPINLLFANLASATYNFFNLTIN